MTERAPVGPAGAAAQASLTRLATVVAGASLAWTGVWFLVAPPESAGANWWPLVVTSWALAVLTLSPLRYRESRVLAALPFTALLLMTMMLTITKARTGLVGWWLQLELIAVAAAVAAMALPSLKVTILGDSAVVGLVTVAAFRGVSAIQVSATPLSGLTASARVLVLTITLAAAAYLLRRSAAASDRVLASAQADEVSEATQVWLARRDDQVRRFLHDSGLNTLEAVSRGVAGDLVEDLRRRCASDVQRWLTFATPPPPNVAAAFEPALAEARLRGVLVAASYDAPSSAPPSVLAAMGDACAEALRNAAKHANCSEARVVVHSSTSSVLVEVRDDGAGFDTANRADGLGLDLSIHRRLAEVGGTAQIDSRLGGGTTVRLTWPAVDPSSGQAGTANRDAAERIRPGGNLPETLSSLAAIPVIVVFLTSVFGTVANWSSTSLPWLYAVAGVATAGAAAWFLRRLRAGLLNSADMAMVFATLFLTPLLTPLADPYCSAATSTALIPDGRLVLLALVGVFLAQWRWTAGSLMVSVLALGVASWMWWHTWPPCAATSIPALFTLLLTGVAATMFGRAVLRTESAALRAHRAESNRRLREAQLRTDALVRQQWALPAARQARDTLASIAGGREVNEPELAREAARRAARLRCALQIHDLPDPLAGQFAALVDMCTEADLAVTLRGSPPDLKAPSWLFAALAADLAAWRADLDTAPVEGVGVTLARGRGWQSILIRLAMVAPAAPTDEIITRAITPPDTTSEAFGQAAAAASKANNDIDATDATTTRWEDDEGKWWHAEWLVK